MALPHLLSAIAVAGYLLTAFLIFRNGSSQSNSITLSLLPKLTWLGTLLLHCIALAVVLFTATGLNLNFQNAISVVVWFIALLLFFSSWRHPLGSLALVVLPALALVLTISLTHLGSHAQIVPGNLGLQWHILSSLLSFSVLTLGAAQALLLAYQEKRLRRHHLAGWVLRLPPMQYMEELLFQLIGVGFALLTLSLLSGWFFLEDIFAQHLVHKTVLSIIAWVIFAVLLTGRLTRGWRGRTAIRWTLWGYMLLVVAYFGSKLVLEIILRRT